jgi:hypothetical protein
MQSIEDFYPLSAGAGHGLGQDRVDFIQNFAAVGAFRKDFLVDTCFAGASNQISDFEIVFIFKRFCCHVLSQPLNDVSGALFKSRRCFQTGSGTFISTQHPIPQGQP